MKLFPEKTEKIKHIEWDGDADAAVSKAPFFVRPRIKAKVEEYCRNEGVKRVRLEDVEAVKNSFTKNMHRDIKAYQISACFSSSGCPNRIISSDKILKDLENELKRADITVFLRKSVKEKELRFHHELRLTISDCPNSCSQPQIADFGLIAASIPEVSEKNCTLCGECVESCPDRAIELDYEKSCPTINYAGCQKCGICARICRFSEIESQKQGYRIMLGGKLGRHPRLGMELPGIYTEHESINIFKWCLEFYLRNSSEGKRFSHIFSEDDFGELVRKVDLGTFSS